MFFLNFKINNLTQAQEEMWKVFMHKNDLNKHITKNAFYLQDM